MLYVDNLAFIQKHNPIIYRDLFGNTSADETVEYFPESDNFLVSRDGMKVLLHSEFNREREFDRLLNQVSQVDKTIVLFGLGNGQIIKAINQRFPDLDHLVVIEPNLEIVRCFLEKHHFAEEFSVFYKVSFILGKSEDEARKTLENLVLSMDFVEKKISFIASVAYRTLYADYCTSMTRGILEAIRFHRVNKNTLESFRWHWLINAWRNLKHVSPDVGVFRETFAGRPAVIVSAGPSLQKNIHLLREVKNRALVIAVGSAISILDSHGIVPHFRIAVDAAVENKALFAKIDTGACPLLYNDHLFFEIVPNYQGKKVQMLSSNSDTLVSYIFRQAKIDAMPVRSGFSVANIALYLLLQLKCSTIIFMGQDLCYTRGKLHAEGSWDEQIETQYIRKQIEAVDVLGNAVYTDKTFLGMKKIFENIIAASLQAKFLNATEGGLAIEGAENVRLADLLDNELSASFPFEEEIERILQEETDKLQGKKEKIDGVVAEIKQDIETILDYCGKIDEKYQEVYQMVEKHVNKKRVMSETRKLRNMIQNLSKVEFYDKVIMPTFQEKMEIRRGTVDYARDDWRRQWSKEIGLLRLEMEEIRVYLLRMQDLLEEYQGEKQLNIVFE